MPRRFRTVLSCALFLGAAASAAIAQEMPAEVREGAAYLRLFSATGSALGDVDAGLEIRLDPGWKTYWVNPGPVGLAPRLDWTGSTNLRTAEVLWPAPQRFSEGNADSAGYAGQVILPLKLEPADASKPVQLHLSIQFGLCSTICVPAQARLGLTSGARPADALTGARLAGFVRRVPVPDILGGDEDLAVLPLQRGTGGAPQVAVRAPAGAASVDLFAEDAKGVLRTLPQQTEIRKDGARIYRLDLRSPSGSDPLKLVAVADARAISVMLPLDGSGAGP